MADLEQEYRRHFAASGSLASRAREVLPDGLTHDSRRFAPHPVYIARSEGPYKWTEEGDRLIDYGMGHGALILGHANPAVVRAVQDQVAKGTHFSASHRLEVEWAERVRRLVPSAELVRFTASGTEATMLAMRLARARTGRPRILKLQGHFHGWHDEALVGSRMPFDELPSLGLNPGTVEMAKAIPQNDVESLERELATEQYAAMILEPSGASWATVPLAEGYLEAVRRATASTGTVLIFDEVITGFRLAPGGAQEHFGITPDLTCLAKILGGGLPGGAVAGSEPIVGLLRFDGAGKRVVQQGTFNANPLSAAAGIAALDQIVDGAPQRRATALAERLCARVNQMLESLDLPGCAWNVGSLFHIHVGDTCPIWIEEGKIAGELDVPALLTGMPHLHEVREGLLLKGVDLFRDGGLVSAVHTEADIDHTIQALAETLQEL
ncbi:MAG TPA: aminotransferase class III-fold pyridoxal phosphate-dependent enzyme [Candidatus Dormibacteraeota bacterium]|jgi:glutamate-1-semialdehyde 2,1-aminomutase|nr:aminotransferase class III-fold pyridoxal phosphate-dependent enzyme [Candidatus Dormibacteraeota bacterium]